MNLDRVLAITLDLDDTLWPVWPVIEQAQRRLQEWLVATAPITAARFDAKGMRAIREEVGRRFPELAHDLSALRLESLRLALHTAGDDPSLAEAGFEVFIEARHQVELYPGVADALRRLSARFPLFALSNGNADLRRIGLADGFHGMLSAREFGAGKPDPRIFAEACRRLGHGAERVLHVGDDWLTDVRGARDAGLQAAWVLRSPKEDQVAVEEEGICTVADLSALAERLGC